MTETGQPARFAVDLGRAAGFTAGYAAALRRSLATFRPDVVHTNGVKMHLLGVYATDAPVVWHMHDYVGARRLSRRLLEWTVARCAAVVANSDSVAADLRAAFGTRARITRVYNGVDLGRFTPAGDILDLDRVAGTAAASGAVVRVGLLATFARWKGHETFLRAVADVPERVPVRAYIIGGPVYETEGSQYTEEELRAVAQRLGVSNRIVFTRFVDRPEAALRALDIAVHASTAPEPFGLAIAEAMACGRAVIVSGAGGAAELVTPDVDALTHAPGDAPALAAAIQALAVDPDRRAALGRAARLTAVRRFDRARLARELVPVYTGVNPQVARVAR